MPVLYHTDRASLERDTPAFSPPACRRPSGRMTIAFVGSAAVEVVSPRRGALRSGSSAARGSRGFNRSRPRLPFQARRAGQDVTA